MSRYVLNARLSEGEGSADAGGGQRYLNPNGLKYHVEKGTCKIEIEEVEAEGEGRKEEGSAPEEPRDGSDGDGRAASQ